MSLPFLKQAIWGKSRAARLLMGHHATLPAPAARPFGTLATDRDARRGGAGGGVCIFPFLNIISTQRYRDTEIFSSYLKPLYLRVSVLEKIIKTRNLAAAHNY